MRDLSERLENRIIIKDRLIGYGFGKDYIYENILDNPNFKAVIAYTNDTLTSKVVDLELDEDYVRWMLKHRWQVCSGTEKWNMKK